LGWKGIVSKRATSLYRGGPSRNWLKIKNLVESEFVLLGTEVDDSGIPGLGWLGSRMEIWSLPVQRSSGRLLIPRAEWADKFAAMSIEKPAFKGLRRANKAKWLKPESASWRGTSRRRAPSGMPR
jgi:hypothetical protein